MNEDTLGHSNRWNQYTAGIGIALFILFTILGFFHNTLTRMDTTVMQGVWGIRSDWLNDFFIFITYVGSGYVSIPVMILLALYFLVNRNFILAVVLIFNLIGVRTANLLLKTSFDRTRPNDNPLLDVGGLSFPSGHSMNSAAFIGFLGYLLWRYLKKRGKQAGFVLVLTWGLVFLIGFSRVYLGVHFPSDVIAGFSAGGIWLILTLVLLKVLTKMRSEGG